VIIELAAAAVVAAALVLLLVRGRAAMPTAPRLRTSRPGRRARRPRLRRLRSRLPGRLRGRRPAADDAPSRPEDEELARVLRLSTRTAGDVHHLLRPVLADIARGRFVARGVDLDTALVAEPARIRALLGDELSDLLDPRRPLPDDFFGAGIPLVAIEGHVARLEAL